ncbi:unnamed protein product [Durusdinium trenchii]|uniref:Uncharacterized protein n=1 Tax=Durusdinium trenchii TaxID=1381693 RepID=A0ABP0PCC8_9DINO
MTTIEERSKRFTPKVNTSFCMARVWNGGLGGQCPLMPVSNSFGLCKTHAHRDAAEGLSHGRVDGPIPLEKLEEFEERWEKRGSNGSFVQGSPHGIPPASPQSKARSPSRTPRRIRTPPPEVTPKRKLSKRATPDAPTPSTPSIRKTPLKEGAGSCLARVWASGRGGQKLGRSLKRKAFQKRQKVILPFLFYSVETL